MIVTFFGHSSFCENEKYEQKLLYIFEKYIENAQADFYLGGYGGFDSFAFGCCNKFKHDHADAKLIFITPYMDPQYSKLRYTTESRAFDEIIYPELETTPPRYAISRRNRWMAEKADLIISYITHNYGGAYAAYAYANKLGKTTINLFHQ